MRFGASAGRNPELGPAEKMLGPAGTKSVSAASLGTVTIPRDANGDYGRALVALARIRARRSGHPSAGDGGDPYPATARAPAPAAGARRRESPNVVSLAAYRARRRAELAQGAEADAAARRNAR